jgi:hypothetical protein
VDGKALAPVKGEWKVPLLKRRSSKPVIVEVTI